MLRHYCVSKTHDFHHFPPFSPPLSSLHFLLTPLLSVSLVVVFTILCCRRILCLVLSSFYMCAWCCEMCEETQNIKMERNMLRAWKDQACVHQVTWWWRKHGSRWTSGRWVWQEDQSTNGRTAMMRARGRSIARKCDVWEHDLQNSYYVLWSGYSRCSNDGSTCYSSQRSANEATADDGSFDHWRANRELVEV